MGRVLVTITLLLVPTDLIRLASHVPVGVEMTRVAASIIPVVLVTTRKPPEA